MSGRPVLVMLLSRHPYREKSGRGFMLRQRIAQARARFDLRLIAFDHPSGDASDEGITFMDMAPPPTAALNILRLGSVPMQAWLYYRASTRQRIEAIVRESGAAAVYVDMLRLAPLVQRLPRTVALVVDYDDLLSARYRLAQRRGYDVMGFLAGRFGPFAGVARALATPLLWEEARRCEAYEQKMLERADLALFTSPREAKSMMGRGTVVLAAPPTLAPYAPLAPAPGKRLIFLGNMHYAENIAMLRALADAAEALTGDGLWPAGTIIEAVGDHAPDLPARFPTAPIRFLGRVEDLATLAGAGIFLAPVTSGSGVKLKMLDGMALSCPVVATEKACEGLAVRANRDVLVAPNVKTLLHAALKLRDRPLLKAMLARRARRYLERAHAPELGVAVADAIEAAIVRAQARADHA